MFKYIKVTNYDRNQQGQGEWVFQFGLHMMRGLENETYYYWYQVEVEGWNISVKIVGDTRDWDILFKVPTKENE